MVVELSPAGQAYNYINYYQYGIGAAQGWGRAAHRSLGEDPNAQNPLRSGGSLDAGEQPSRATSTRFELALIDRQTKNLVSEQFGSTEVQAGCESPRRYCKRPTPDPQEDWPTVSLPTLLFAALLAASAPESVLKGAIDDFEFGEHGAAAEKLQSILKPNVLKSKENVIVARQYLGACYYLLSKKDQSRTQFSMLLALDPTHRLDPAVFSPALVKLFQQVRAETGLALAEPPPKKPEPKTLKVEPTPPPPIELVVPAPALAHNAALSLIPFGGGQFANNHPIRGGLFAAAEVGLLATALATFVQFESLKIEFVDGNTGKVTDVRFDPRDVDRANRLQSIYLATFWTGIVVMAAGVVEALISYPGDDLATSSAAHPAQGAALNQPFVFSF